MNTNNFTNNRKLYPPIFLAIVLYLLTNPPISAQVKKNDAQTAIPIVNQEVYQSIVQFYEYDRNIPLDAQIVSNENYEGANKQKIIFRGVNNSQVPSLLIVPKDGQLTHPIVLIADGLGGEKNWWVDDKSFSLGGLVTKSLLKKGFAVMVCDAVFHGERSWENSYSSQPWPWNYPYTFRHIVMQTGIEYRRAIDYLTTRADIDTSRIGMMGISMGGVITFALSSIDSRIKSAIAGLTPPFKEYEFQSIAPSTFASRVQVNSFLMFIGTKDELYSTNEARKLFDMISVKKKEFIEYNTGHYVSKEYADMASEWFFKTLK
jgi:cephalosporin-C deacetylase-like acetyl esterase